MALKSTNIIILMSAEPLFASLKVTGPNTGGGYIPKFRWLYLDFGSVHGLQDHAAIHLERRQMLRMAAPTDSCCVESSVKSLTFR